MNRKQRAALFGVTLATVVGGAGSADAVQGLYSWDGNDYSHDINYVKAVEVCDQESDNHGVHADFRLVGSSENLQVRDGNGSASPCGVTPNQNQKIYRHRVVEEINFQPDQFGSWVYPS
jgi:hypothetical protein